MFSSMPMTILTVPDDILKLIFDTIQNYLFWLTEKRRIIMNSRARKSLFRVNLFDYWKHSENKRPFLSQNKKLEGWRKLKHVATIISQKENKGKVVSSPQ